MHMLYDSDTYSVTHMLANGMAAEPDLVQASTETPKTPPGPTLARHGFEIVDKRTNKEVYLDGSWAELFQQHISAWQKNTPTQEEVEDTLEQYAELAQNPILVQLAAMVGSHPEAYPEATIIAIQTIGPREADTWLFTVGHKETLTLPGGEQTALKLVRNPRKEFDQRVELWLAPAMSYLPVRIRITEANGAYVDQKWRASHKDP